MADLFCYPLGEARRSQRSIERENHQFNSRWNIIRYNHPIPLERRDPSIRPCPRCAARWYCDVAQQEERHFDSGGSVVVQVCTLEAGLVARVGEAPAQSSSEGPNDLIGSLRQLMAWKQEGLLSDVEFANAKQQLGL